MTAPRADISAQPAVHASRQLLCGLQHDVCLVVHSEERTNHSARQTGLTGSSKSGEVDAGPTESNRMIGLDVSVVL